MHVSTCFTLHYLPTSSFCQFFTIFAFFLRKQTQMSFSLPTTDFFIICFHSTEEAQSSHKSVLFMERQRSFAVKRSRFLVFSLTISSCLIFLTFFFFWVIKAIPSINRQAHIQYKKTPLTSALKPSTTNLLPSSEVNTSSILRDSSVSAEFPRKENGTISKVAADDVKLSYNSNGPPNGGGTSFGPKLSEVVSSGKPEIDSGLAVDSIPEHPQDLRAVPDAFSLRAKLPNGNRIEDQKSKKVCDLTDGKWVFDKTYPLYRNTTCPFIDEGFNCEANGRLDKDYMKWRWQPKHCDIPRFNATKMLELIAGKRVVFAGDSLNRNQWESMLCLLMGAIKDPRKVYETRGRRITKEKGSYSFKFVDYNCTIEYYVSHFLVHESKARIGKKRVQTLRIDTIDKASSKWRGADILVFNTAHWWSHHKTKAGVNYYQEGEQVHPRMDVSVAFRRAMISWGSWIDKYINPKKTKVFFRSYSPSHFSGGQWNTGGHCKEASEPINSTIPIGIGSEKNAIVEEVLRQMKTPVTFLNITGLSSYRMDGHPSIYGRKSSSISLGVEDCSHWCVPGVPDSWNQILYYHLLLHLT
ncbi:hypothetical protein M9H77_05853 [Catharanthus roseus]|uniref:Uncharacterized protein n=1 Tax=Catharanthus roseus TaxID=4058 RepID=A0ACC0BQH5_CATRO|nr:hypothetical protein M9H77_05853 [Catharanthus roseus]